MRKVYFEHKYSKVFKFILLDKKYLLKMKINFKHVDKVGVTQNK